MEVGRPASAPAPDSGAFRELESVFIIDPAPCIGCQACVQACADCGTHRGTSMIHLEYVDRANTVQTTPQVCMAADRKSTGGHLPFSRNPISQSPPEAA